MLMFVTGFTIALMLPWMMGISWMYLIVHPWLSHSRSSLWLLLGYGYPLGMLGTTFLLRLGGVLGIKLDFAVYAALHIPLILISLLAGWRIVRYHQGIHRESSQIQGDAPLWHKWSVGLLLALLAVRFGTIYLELAWRPLFAWDGWTFYAPPGRIWFELKELVPMVAPDEWRAQEGAGVFTPFGHNRLPTISLIYTWHALGLGEWNDALINRPWLFCGVALAMGFYGQARTAGAGPLMAMVFVYILMSLPLVNVNMALAGYAEIWVATVFGFAFMAFSQWVQNRDPVQGGLAILFALLLIQTKSSALAWVLLFLPAWIAAVLPHRLSLTIVGLALAGLLALVWIGPNQALEIPRLGLVVSLHKILIPGLVEFELEYHSVWNAFIITDLIMDNWHLFWYLVLALMLYGVASGLMFRRALFAPSLLLFCGFLFIYVVYFYTDRYIWAENWTQHNRALFHMVPMICFHLLTLVQEQIRRSQI